MSLSICYDGCDWQVKDTGAFVLESLYHPSQSRIAGKAPVASDIPCVDLPVGTGVRCGGGFGMVRLTCPECGGDFEEYPSRVQPGVRHFCSMACYNAATASARTLVSRFWAKVDKSAGVDGCWVWTAARFAFGYGQFRVCKGSSNTVAASRVVWQLVNGPIPDGLWVLHNCPGGDNPACVNPAHLWLGTHLDNMADKVAKGRQPRGERGPRAKLTEEHVRIIRSRVAMGTSQATLAREFGISPGVVGRIVQHKKWKHVV